MADQLTAFAVAKLRLALAVGGGWRYLFGWREPGITRIAEIHEELVSVSARKKRPVRRVNGDRAKSPRWFVERIQQSFVARFRSHVNVQAAIAADHRIEEILVVRERRHGPAAQHGAGKLDFDVFAGRRAKKTDAIVTDNQ